MLAFIFASPIRVIVLSGKFRTSVLWGSEMLKWWRSQIFQVIAFSLLSWLLGIGCAFLSVFLGGSGLHVLINDPAQANSSGSWVTVKWSPADSRDRYTPPLAGDWKLMSKEYCGAGCGSEAGTYQTFIDDVHMTQSGTELSGDETRANVLGERHWTWTGNYRPPGVISISYDNSQPKSAGNGAYVLVYDKANDLYLGSWVGVDRDLFVIDACPVIFVRSSKWHDVTKSSQKSPAVAHWLDRQCEKSEKVPT